MASLAQTLLLALGLILAVSSQASSAPRVVDSARKVTYEGRTRYNIEAFLGIPYGQDTSGANRFKPPRPHVPAEGSTIAAQNYGPACPQWYGEGSWVPPFTLDNVTAISEDCLSLNVVRPQGVRADANLPVIVYIYGGTLVTGQASDTTILPDGLILEAVASGTPVLHVAFNYRLGVFGFAQSAALQAEGSHNAGYRDQRLALEWVRDNIAVFGGDPTRITVYGQSSGGSSIGIHLLAYGGTQPAPFQRAILESGVFDNGITANYSRDTTQLVAAALNCTDNVADQLACLRAADTETLNKVQLDVYTANVATNAGALWLAAVDGDFLPGSPSELVTAGKIASNVSVAFGWMADDLAVFTDPTVTTPENTEAQLATWAPLMSNASRDALLALYPSADFAANAAAGLSAEFYRLARVFRDANMACQPLWLGAALAQRNGLGSVFLFEWNQTILGPIYEAVGGGTGYGVFHESEFPYVFGNLSRFDVHGWPFAPSEADRALARRAPRSYAHFAATGKLSEGKETFVGWSPAFAAGADAGDQTAVFVVGGPEEGLSAIGGDGSQPAWRVRSLGSVVRF